MDLVVLRSSRSKIRPLSGRHSKELRKVLQDICQEKLCRTLTPETLFGGVRNAAEKLPRSELAEVKRSLVKLLR